MLLTSGPRRTLTFAFATALLIGAGSLFAGSVDAARPGRIGIDAFMAGLACVESVGNYEAVNERSGARGKYQFMPRIWRAWSISPMALSAR